MGALDKEARIIGRDLQTAYKGLQEIDREESGNDPYSGGWNNISGIKEVSAKEFDRRVGEGLSKHSSAIAKCIKKPVKNTNAIKTKVETFSNKGARKWETRYVAVTPSRDLNISEPLQADAIKKARAYVDKNPRERVSVEIRKVLIGQKTVIARISYKPSKKEAKGVWEIAGCASY